MPAHFVSLFGVRDAQQMKEKLNSLLADRSEPWTVRLEREGAENCYLRLQCPGFLAERIINDGECADEGVYETIRAWLAAYDQ